MSDSSVPLHCESVAGDDAAALWHVPVPSPGVGRLVWAPGVLGEMLDDRTVVRGLCAEGLMWLWLAEGLHWRDVGPRVRDGLREALAWPREWVLCDAGSEVLERVAGYVLDGALSAYISSHGGRVRALSFTGDTAVFAFEGSCAHCPAADVTLHARIESEIRAHYPALAGVAVDAMPGSSRRRNRLRFRSAG